MNENNTNNPMSVMLVSDQEIPIGKSDFLSFSDVG